ALFGAEATLFHLGVTNVPPHKLHPNKSNLREAEWASVPPQLAATLCAYIEQVRLSLRPSTMYGIEAALRGFAVFIAHHDTGVTCVADLTRRHIEAYKLQLARRPSARGGLEQDQPGRASRLPAHVIRAAYRLGWRRR